MTSQNIDELLKENDLLKNEIKDLRLKLDILSDKRFENVSCQTDDMSEAGKGDNAAACASDWTNGQDSEMSIADMVRTAAEQAQTEQHLPGYVLQPSGHYYNADSGYYYDSHSSLFYHPSTEQYYKYNPSSGQYTVYTGEEELLTVPVQNECERVFTRRYYHKMAKKYDVAENIHRNVLDPGAFETLIDIVDQVCEDSARPSRKQKRTYAQLMHHSKPDEPQILAELIDLTVDNEGSTSESDTDSEEDYAFPEHVRRMRMIEREGSKFPGCIRLMQNPGSVLSIVTITGAIIGRDNDCDVVLQDVNASRKHANITYDSKNKKYEIVDNNSSNGTTINGKYLEPPERMFLSHGDIISICSTTLNVHLHTGNNTCSGCEPGLLPIPVITSASNYTPSGWKGAGGRERSRKNNLKAIKKSYGLNGNDNNPIAVISSTYSDRAANRRKEVGSEHEAHAKGVQETASVHTAISSGNKGFKMLEKMGWKEGTTLGKTNEGIVEPITAKLRIGRSGLGSGPHTEVSLDESGTGVNARKKEMAMKTVARFTQSRPAPIFIEEDEDDDDLVVIKEKTKN